jgi:hypothetical protein
MWIRVVALATNIKPSKAMGSSSLVESSEADCLFGLVGKEKGARALGERLGRGAVEINSLPRLEDTS